MLGSCSIHCHNWYDTAVGEAIGAGMLTDLCS